MSASNAPCATYACLPCRTLKRKCTRELPVCSLCLRLNKICDYAATNNQASNIEPVQADTSSAGQADLGSAQPISTIPRLIQLPTRYFLDSDSHQAAGYSSAPRCTVPPSMIDCLVYVEDYQSICDAYFSSIQAWFPFLSEKRMAARLQNSGPEGDLRLTLLLLSMKLVATTPLDQDEALCSSIYQKAVELSGTLERFGMICLELLQSTILISIYEAGHGIYPPAFTSIGRAARLGLILGFHDRKNAPQFFKSPNTWTLREEERRAWWAVVILDRYVNLGIQNIPLAAPNPNNGDLLPCTEDRWKHGQIGINEPLLVASLSEESNIGLYANICQAAHTTGRLLEHRNRTKAGADHRSQLMEGQQLHHIITDLTTHTYREFTRSDTNISESRLTAIALCGSARLILANMYGCNEYYPTDNGPRLPEETAMQEASLNSIEEMINCSCVLGEYISSLDDREIASTSPLVCHFLYLAASQCAWVVREFQDPEQKTRLGVILQGLMALQPRWKVVDDYLKLLQEEEMS
ncbi:hypothetical protein P170DRAFT_478302 [Aspergillus steynii IBT 23096]|uniref:Zn(2)-C6 fungal-type domain-containing protein n=1 Tax=Aspergillus steynii IBT 23096 TaxID=1392250 RepID=A0A2I2G3K0_9EURO|nr:uncharacterized protein P170DRAFT_478302 [Aspergillus steynii IBT 23096]PLB47453.1 hypothetical protein P170DRAFT_478302 [Aspergillus steynii IBT 23096]